MNSVLIANQITHQLKIKVGTERAKGSYRSSRSCRIPGELAVFANFRVSLKSLGKKVNRTRVLGRGLFEGTLER